ncbi:MAG: serine--tRNA ligase [Asticcacaulis sp.]|uniref:serine--tRNA ligase n=1 Tax=Asticcacaulis sp. TaxID=1872648 RepID=UPI003F7C353F
MHDIKALRETPDLFIEAWTRRGRDSAAKDVHLAISLDGELRAAQTKFQTAQAELKKLSAQIGQAKAQKDEARAQTLMAEVEGLKAAIAEAQETERAKAEDLRNHLAALPNLPFDDVPVGADEHGNVEVRRHGAPVALGFTPKDHADLGEALGMMDFEAAAKISGSRFVVLKGQLARLERAIGQFMLDVQTEEHGYTEVNPPVLVKQPAVFGTGQLPKFYDDLFLVMDPMTRNDLLKKALSDKGNINPNDDLVEAIFQALEAAPTNEQFFAVPTAEVSLTNLVREAITAEEELPLRLTALTNCFRAEAGSAGRDTKGMIRQHQFQKVELVSITTPEQSGEEHERMTQCAENILKKLDLSFRTMLLCTGDMGFGAKKTYDLEVWLPSQNTYREISSCSNCGDFQARRMDARTRKSGEKGTRFVHTLNGSGLAVGRTLVAIMENYQDEGGRIAVPSVLIPYMGGLTHIG